MESKDNKIIEDFEAIPENIFFAYHLLSNNQKINVIMKVDLIKLLEAKNHHDIEVYNILAEKYNIAVGSVRKARERIDKT